MDKEMFKEGKALLRLTIIVEKDAEEERHYPYINRCRFCSHDNVEGETVYIIVPCEGVETQITDVRGRTLGLPSLLICADCNSKYTPHGAIDKWQKMYQEAENNYWWFRGY